MEGTRRKTTKSLRSGKKVWEKSGFQFEEFPSESPEKKKRTWESWSFEDKNNFFDGLKQYGRDFGKIKTFMSLKAAKDHQIKTKDQVRGLYYRIWSTVSKYVQSSCFPEKLTDKSGQELYAMMAYGELRRKLKVEPSNHRKILELKFGELVKTQQTCVKFKGKTVKIKIALPESGINKKRNESNFQIATFNDRTRVNLLPIDNHSLRCVQSVAACPQLLVHIALDTPFSDMKKMLASKWRTYPNRIELSADFKNERIFIQIDEIQKSKNGKLTVHWSTKMNDPESGPGPIEIHSLPDDPTFLLLYLANEQPESLKVHYRFIRDTPHCEPVQLLAKCASIFTEIITDVDKTRDLILKDDFKEPSSVSSNSKPGPRSESGSPKKDQKRKRNEQFSKEEVNKHLQELNGLTKRTNQIRSDPFNPRNTPNRSPQIQYSPVDEMESRGVKQGENFDDPKNEDSNSSISNILRSVLRDEPSYPTQLEELELQTQLNNLLNENSLDYERITNFSDLISDINHSDL